MNLENLKKVWQKAKDLYGWDEGNLYFYKDKTEYHRRRMEYMKEKLTKAKNENDAYKWKVRLENEQMWYKGCDMICKDISNKLRQRGKIK